MAGDAVAQFRFTNFLVIGIFNSTYNAPGVQSPVIDSLINKLLPRREIKKNYCRWDEHWMRINVELLHAANVVHGGRPSPWWDKFSQPAVRPVYSLGIDPGGMTLIKRRNCRQPDNRERDGRLSDSPSVAGDPNVMGDFTINFFIVQIAPGGPVDQAIPPLSLVMPEYYPAQAVKVFAQPCANGRRQYQRQ